MATVVLLLTVVLGCGAGVPPATEGNKTEEAHKVSDSANAVTIKVLDVGQGDAVLIKTKGQTALIDTSDTDEREKLMARLSEAGVERVDKMILTHPHADHIGGAKTVIENYTVGQVYDNGVTRGASIYKGYIAAAKKRGVSVESLKAGDVVDLGGAKLEVLYPTKAQKEKYAAEGDYNNTSLVMRLVVGDFAMLLTGDAEKTAENEIINSTFKSKLKAKVLKAGHHGSKSSSGVDFLKLVNPEVVVVSAGEPGKAGGNTYGHPHRQALNNFQKVGANVLWTYPNGTVTIITDGKGYDVMAEKATDWLDAYLKGASN